MNFYKELELILEAQKLSTKIDMFEHFYDEYKKGNVEFEQDYKTKKFNEASYSSTCKIVPPQDVPKRSNLTTKEGQIILIHAIAHIEYSAIDLALDAAYRFHNMPKKWFLLKKCG